MYFHYHSSLKRRLLSTLALIVALLVSAVLIINLDTRPFSYTVFFIILALVPICGVITFYFLRLNFCPVLQIYQEEVIVSNFWRRRISINDIKDLEMCQEVVKISYLHNDGPKNICLPVTAQPNLNVHFQSGKLLVSGHTRKKMKF